MNWWPWSAARDNAPSHSRSEPIDAMKLSMKFTDEGFVGVGWPLSLELELLPLPLPLAVGSSWALLALLIVGRRCWMRRICRWSRCRIGSLLSKRVWHYTSSSWRWTVVRGSPITNADTDVNRQGQCIAIEDPVTLPHRLRLDINCLVMYTTKRYIRQTT